MRVRHRAGVQSGGDHPGDVGHVDPEGCSDLVGDRAEGGEVEQTRIGAPAGDEYLRASLEGLRAHDIHIDEEG